MELVADIDIMVRGQWGPVACCKNCVCTSTFLQVHSLVDGYLYLSRFYELWWVPPSSIKG